MIAALGGWLTPTRAVGLTSFGASAVASGIAWARLAGQPGRRRLPMVLTLIHSLLFLDIVFNLRWHLHGVLVDAAVVERIYEGRRLPQTVALLILAAILALASLVLVRRMSKRKGALLAVLGTWIAVASWCMEVISLHDVDVVLYETKGPFMPVVLIWILVGLMTTVGISFYAGAARV